ncbi:MAG: electron transfer flavoprotein subunit beta/FixA family protein [Deltaproteobacteria bacterium]|nr:electron transfer flavoprotein subunit beta/FixA family protein [Deltaproteobacteria bacterium]
MEIIVCLRQTAIIKEEPKVQSDGKTLDLSGFNRHLNEWDAYALEEALLLAQKYGGDASVISLGPGEAQEVLFYGLAAGAKRAIHILTPDQQHIDNWTIANVLARVIKKGSFDLVMTGVQAEDDGCAEIGATLAHLLGIPHASLVMRVEYEQGQNAVKVDRELEAGYVDSLRLTLPALLTIQTGISQPRYISSMRLRRFKKSATITKVSFEDIVSEGEGPSPREEVLGLYPYQPEASQVEVLEGSPEAMADQLFERLQSKGVL